MVTFEGALLEKYGAMTGGYLKKKQEGGFGAAVEDGIARLSSALAGKREEAAGFERSIARLSGEVDEARRRRAEIEQGIARYGSSSRTTRGASLCRRVRRGPFPLRLLH